VLNHVVALAEYRRLLRAQTMDAERLDNRHGWHPTEADPPTVSDDTGEWPPLQDSPAVLREDDGEPDGPSLPAITQPELIRDTVEDWKQRGLLPADPAPVISPPPVEYGDDAGEWEPVTRADGVGMVIAFGLVFLGGFALILLGGFLNGH
jgi:hypothetical protein